MTVKGPEVHGPGITGPAGPPPSLRVAANESAHPNPVLVRAHNILFTLLRDIPFTFASVSVCAEVPDAPHRDFEMLETAKASTVLVLAFAPPAKSATNPQPGDS